MQPQRLLYTIQHKNGMPAKKRAETVLKTRCATVLHVYCFVGSIDRYYARYEAIIEMRYHSATEATRTNPWSFGLKQDDPQRQGRDRTEKSGAASLQMMIIYTANDSTLSRWWVFVYLHA